MYRLVWGNYLIFEHKSNKKRLFTKEEDNIILDYVNTKGQNWKVISSLLNNRSEKQCRERYRTYLNPSLRNDPWTTEEDQKLISLYKQYGPKWVVIAKHFHGRSDNMIKNRFNYHIIKRPRKMKIDQKKILQLLDEHDISNDVNVKSESEIIEKTIPLDELIPLPDLFETQLFEL